MLKGEHSGHFKGTQVYLRLTHPFRDIDRGIVEIPHSSTQNLLGLTQGWQAGASSPISGTVWSRVWPDTKNKNENRNNQRTKEEENKTNTQCVSPCSCVPTGCSPLTTGCLCTKWEVPPLQGRS